MENNRRAVYKKYMTSDAWRAKRDMYFRRYGRKCMACGTTKHIVLHHVTYERFGKELLTDLRGLCDTCHKKVHQMHRQKGGDLRFWTDRHIFLEKKKRTK